MVTLASYSNFLPRYGRIGSWCLGGPGLLISLTENHMYFSVKSHGPHASSIDAQVTQRIAQKGAGAVFTPADFLDLGSRNAVDLALSRRARAGTIRKLARGL